MLDFGTSFKTARESRDVTLEKIAQETCISTRFLRAIEEETFHVLPGGVFNRGFIRTYAQRLGLDVEAKLSEYAALTSDLGMLKLETVGSPPKPNPDRQILPIAVGLLVVIILIYYVTNQGRPEAEPAANAVTTSEGASTLSRPAPSVSRPSVVAPRALPANQERNAEAEVISVGAPTNVAPDRSTAITVRDSGPESASDRGIRIQIDVHDATWISLLSDGEQIVEGVTLAPGTRRSFQASEALELRIGNAAGLTLTINGEPVPDLGSDNQVRNLRITPGGFRFF